MSSLRVRCLDIFRSGIDRVGILTSSVLVLGYILRVIFGFWVYLRVGNLLLRSGGVQGFGWNSGGALRFSRSELCFLLQITICCIYIKIRLCQYHLFRDLWLHSGARCLSSGRVVDGQGDRLFEWSSSRRLEQHLWLNHHFIGYEYEVRVHQSPNFVYEYEVRVRQYLSTIKNSRKLLT